MTLQLPAAREIIIEDGTFEIFNTSWFKYLEGVYRAIRGGSDIKLGGLLDINTTSASNVGVGSTDMIEYTLPANTLTTTGDILKIEAWGVYAANANNKTVTLEFGGQTILTTGSIAANAGSWKITASIIRTGASTQEIITEIISSNSSVTDSVTRTAGTQTLSNDLTIKCTSTGGADDDITQYSLLTNLFPNS